MSPRRRNNASSTGCVVVLVVLVVVGQAAVGLMSTPYPYILAASVIGFYIIRALVRRLLVTKGRAALSSDIDAGLSSPLDPVGVSIVLHRGESGYLEVPAQLAHQVTTREFVGGSQGMSVPIGGGIRYRFGNFRGHSVSHHSLRVVDSGVLIVTNQRVVFTGAETTVSMPLASVLKFDLFTDAIALHRESKATVDTFFCHSPGLLAAKLEQLLGMRG